MVPDACSHDDWRHFGISRGWLADPSDLREFIDTFAEGAITFDGCDDAIVGCVTRPNLEPLVAYSYDRLIDIHVAQGMTYEEAMEFVEYNIVGLWAGERTPVVLYVT